MSFGLEGYSLMGQNRCLVGPTTDSLAQVATLPHLEPPERAGAPPKLLERVEGASKDQEGLEPSPPWC